MRIKAAVAYEKAAPFVLEDLEIEGPGPSDVLVRMVGVGLCHTDIAARDERIPVPKPVVLGHEGSGIVEKVGQNVTKVKPGDHVVLSFAFCGHCYFCLEGKPAYCEHFVPLNFTDDAKETAGNLSKGDQKVHGHFFGQSSFANYAVVHQNNVISVRKDAPLELLGVLGCGIQTGAGSVMNVLRPHPGQSIVVFGTGAVGVSAIMAARVCGCTTIVAVDVLDSRLDTARELGATHVVKIEKGRSTTQELLAIVPRGIDFALDTSGYVENSSVALDSLATLGTFAFVGVPVNDKPIEASMMNMLMKGLTIRGIIEGEAIPEIFIPQLIDLFMAGRFPFDKMITKYPFDDINIAVEDQKAGNAVKVVFTF